MVYASSGILGSGMPRERFPSLPSIFNPTMSLRLDSSHSVHHTGRKILWSAEEAPPTETSLGVLSSEVRVQDEPESDFRSRDETSGRC
jgi:hypothetical protein